MGMKSQTRTSTRSSGAGKILAILDAAGDALAVDRPLPLLLAISLLAACVWCAWLLDAGFVLGTSAFWRNPHGVIGYGWADMPQTLSGYFYFQRDTWHVPLFQVAKLGAPQGTNIIFTDSIPWVALAGRLLFQATGIPVNLYGIWTVGCLAASAVTMTALVAALGQRNLAAAAMATVAGLCMPELLARWGHTSLMAQFEVPLALIFYVRNRRSGRPWRLFAQATALSVLALWSHAYLFAMVVSIVLATIAQAAAGGSLRWRQAAGILAGLIVILGGLIHLSGYLQSRGELGTGASGPFFSMNLLSPFFPQRSGLLPPFHDTIADGTTRQYEGFSYLGGGVLLLLIATMQRQVQTLRNGLARHPCLLVLLAGCTLFALSNDIYLGTAHILHVPLPLWVLEIASVFRSDGRFFWPVMYALTALAITAAIPLYGRRGVLLLIAGASLQWVDATPLRQAFAEHTRTQEAPHIDLAAWQAAIRRHDSVRVLPQYFCLKPLRWNSEVAIHLQLLAALADRPINSVYASRFQADCAAEQRTEATPRPGARQLSVFLDEFAGFNDMQSFAKANGTCQAGPGIVVCSDIPDEAPMLAALVKTDRGSAIPHR
ncbi:MAG TPA: hypothetical protein DDZ81_03100 [Acetobacteraceae bacterium]|jgi:hypothetical protein|nr:hypothetical protein [Acetobacteraceae bacterium]